MTRYYTLGLLILGTTLAFIQPSFADGAKRVAFEACAQELGIQLPTPENPPQKPDDATREKMDQCMKEKGYDLPKEHAEMKACLEKAGVQLPAGGRGSFKNLDPTTRAAIRACHIQVENSNS